MTKIRIDAVHFADPRYSKDFFYLFRESKRHEVALGDMGGWARGARIDEPEWVRGSGASHPICARAGRGLTLRAKVSATTSEGASGTIRVAPTVDGSDEHLLPATGELRIEEGSKEGWVLVELRGVLPEELGRYRLRLRFTAEGAGLALPPTLTTHFLYTALGRPLLPDHDSARPEDKGLPVDQEEGTLSGTKQRFDHLMFLAGGSSRRHPVRSPEELEALLWRLHRGINDTPGAPPYFDAGHDRHITRDGSYTGKPIDVADQWLAWLKTPAPHWNDASCIGHVQLLKTMAASVGIFVRRAWVLPKTRLFPNGREVSLKDEQLYALGKYDYDAVQRWTFEHGGRSYIATPRLAEPSGAWENFEACAITPGHRFLPGGYLTSALPPSFREQEGFRSARDLLRWWASTERPGFGRRFLCWGYKNPSTGEKHFWDVEGNHYDRDSYVQIRERGKDLPVA